MRQIITVAIYTFGAGDQGMGDAGSLELEIADRQFPVFGAAAAKRNLDDG